MSNDGEEYEVIVRSRNNEYDVSVIIESIKLIEKEKEGGEDSSSIGTNKKDRAYKVLLTIAVICLAIIILEIIKESYDMASNIMAAAGLAVTFFSIEPVHDKINKYLTESKTVRFCLLFIFILFCALVLILVIAHLGVYTFMIPPIFANLLSFVCLMVTIFLLARKDA